MPRPRRYFRTKFAPGGTITPEFYEEEFGILSDPRLTEEQGAKLDEYGFRILFIPAITEDEYPGGFITPNWNMFLKDADAERRPLPGRFVAVETIAKPDWDDQKGCPDDKLGKSIGLKKRFGVSDDDLRNSNGPHARIATLLGFPRERVRSPSVEEWNFVGNMFNHLRKKYNEPLPDLGSTNSWEWCENTFGSVGRLVAGNREVGGLAGVSHNWRDIRDDDVAFRVLVVL